MEVVRHLGLEIDRHFSEGWKLLDTEGWKLIDNLHSYGLNLLDTFLRVGSC